MLQGPKEPASWDEVFMGMAREAAKRSKNPGSRFGAVVVTSRNEPVSTGFNGPPPGLPDDQLPWGCQEAKAWHLHAEANALNFAERSRGWVGLRDCRLYVTGRPCHACALLIVRAGVLEVIHGPEVASQSTERDWAMAKLCLRMAGVVLREG